MNGETTGTTVVKEHMMAARKLILDLDTGIDDTLAIAYALGSAGEADLIGVTGTYGNVTVRRGVRNSLAVLHLFGRDDVPVYRASTIRSPTIRRRTARGSRAPDRSRSTRPTASAGPRSRTRRARPSRTAPRSTSSSTRCARTARTS